jgi:hypothetical protein
LYHFHWCKDFIVRQLSLLLFVFLTIIIFLCHQIIFSLSSALWILIISKRVKFYQHLFFQLLQPSIRLLLQMRDLLMLVLNVFDISFQHFWILFHLLCTEFEIIKYFRYILPAAVQRMQAIFKQQLNLIPF